MVKYQCEICGAGYGSVAEAEKCEAQGIIGPDIKPGLLLSHKDNQRKFRLHYGEGGKSPEGHERNYLTEEFEILHSAIYLIAFWNQSALEFTKSLGRYQVATDKQIKKMNNLIKKDFPGTRKIETLIRIRNINIHNNLESLVNLSQ